MKESGAGADTWGRTGAITFDRFCKIKKKATFRCIQEHLQEKYSCKILHGTVQGHILRGGAGRCAPPIRSLCTSPEIPCTSPENQCTSPENQCTSLKLKITFIPLPKTSNKV